MKISPLAEMGDFMLPFDNRPWAKPLARAIIGLSVIAAILVAYYLHSLEELHIPEVTGIVLLLLTIIPPNVAVLMKKIDSDASIAQPRMHTR